MIFGKFLYAIAIFVAILGYIASFFMSDIVKSSTEKFERGIYEEETGFMVDQMFDGIQSINKKPTIVDVASIYDIGTHEDFEQICSSLFDIPGILRVGLAAIVKQEELRLEEDYVSDIYNQSIASFFISNHTIVGDYVVVRFSSPPSIGVVGLVINSDSSRDETLQRVILTKTSVFVDNVLLQDGGGLGRLTFHPSVIDDEVVYIIPILINYVSFFETYTSQFSNLFPKSSLNVIINEQEVYLVGERDKIADNCFSDGTIELCVSSVPIGDSEIYVYVLFLGILLSTLISFILCILNFSLLKAQRDSKFKSRFIADMSHEIRTPMNGILGMSELLEELQLGASEKYYVKTIRSCGETLMSIINDILDMSKIEAGNMDIVNEEISIRNIIGDTFQDLWVSYRTRHGISRNKIEGIVEIMDDIPSVLIGDPVRIRQVYTNLITNAMKFTESGHIKTKVSFVSVTDKYGMIKIDIIDTGIGMTKDNLIKAFSPFKQVHSRSDLGGTGLGLSICTHLCKLMGGDLTGESEIGNGTKMSVIIKAGKKDKFVSKTKHEINFYKNGSIDVSPVQYSSESIKSNVLEFFTTLDPINESTHPEILVVDDVMINRKLLSKIMATIGITVSTCDNGIEAVQTCETKKYSLILMDMVMPMMNGVDACKDIRFSGLNKKTPLVFVSANVQSTAINECNSVGGDGFITKPVTKKKLIETFIKYSSLEEKEFVRRYVSDSV